MTHKVSELKKMIMEYKKKDEHCPTVTGKKKAELVDIASKLGLLSKAHKEEMKEEVKEEMKVVLPQKGRPSGIGSFMVRPPKAIAAAPVAAAGKKKRAPSAYNKFIAEKTKGGKMTMKEAAAAFKAQKGGGGAAEKAEASMAAMFASPEPPAPAAKKAKAEKKKSEVKGEITPKFPKLTIADADTWYGYLGSPSVDERIRKGVPNGIISLIFEAIHGLLPPPPTREERDAKKQKMYDWAVSSLKENIPKFDSLAPIYKDPVLRSLDLVISRDSKYKIPKAIEDEYVDWKKRQPGVPASYMTKDELIAAIVNSGCSKLKGLKLDAMSKDEIVTHLIEDQCDVLYRLM